MAPVLDPTPYRGQGQALTEDVDIMRALLPAWELIEKWRAEVKNNGVVDSDNSGD